MSIPVSFIHGNDPSLSMMPQPNKRNISMQRMMALLGHVVNKLAKRMQDFEQNIWTQMAQQCCVNDLRIDKT